MIKFSWNLVLVVATSLLALALFVSSYGGCIDPRSWAFPSLMVLALPIVVIISLVVLVVTLVLRNKLSSIILGVTLLICFPAIRKVMPLSWNSSPDDERKAFTVMTWNVCGFNQVNEAASCATIKHILEVNADIVLLQEASIDYSDILKLKNVAPLSEQVKKKYPYRSAGYNDIVILSKVPFTQVPDITMRNMQGHSHAYGRAYDVVVKGHRLRLVGLHMQSIGLNDGDKKVFKNITSGQGKYKTEEVKQSLTNKLVSAFKRRANEAHTVRDIIDKSPENLIVCGDFNDVPGSYCYRTIVGDDMHDSFVNCGTLPINTFNRDRFYFKIDHMLYRGNLKAVSMQRDKAGASDHYPLVTTFEWKD